MLPYDLILLLKLISKIDLDSMLQLVPKAFLISDGTQLNPSTSLDRTVAGRKPTVSDDEILDIFREHSDPALSTAEVADILEFSKSGARKRLNSLSESGDLRKKRAGESQIWWLPEYTNLSEDRIVRKA